MNNASSTLVAAVALLVAAFGFASEPDGTYQQLLKGLGTSASLQNGCRIYFEMPTESEILKRLDGAGVDVVVSGDGSGTTIIRHYSKPKFANKAFAETYGEFGIPFKIMDIVYEDRVEPEYSEAAKMLWRYTWFKSMALDLALFESQYGAEINEIVGDKYTKLKKDFCTVVKRYSPQKEIGQKKDIERQFQTLRDDVRKSSVAERFREHLQTLKRLAASAQLSPQAMQDDSINRTLSSEIDSIREIGAGKSKVRMESISRHIEKAHADFREVLQRRFGEIQKSGIPMGKLFANADEIVALLSDFPVGFEEDSLGRIEKIVDSFVAAEEGLKIRRTKGESLRTRYAALQLQEDKPAIGLERIIDNDSLTLLTSIFEKYTDVSVASDEEAEQLEQMLGRAEEMLAQLKCRKAEVMDYLKMATSRHGAISRSGFNEAGAFGSEAAKTECDELLAHAANSPLDYSESDRKRTDDLLAFAELRIEVAKDTHSWIDEVSQRASDVSNNLSRAFSKAQDALGKIRGGATELNETIAGIKKSLSADSNTRNWDTCWKDFNSSVAALSANPFDWQEELRNVAESSVGRMVEIEEEKLAQIKTCMEAIAKRLMTEAVNRIRSEAQKEANQNAAINFFGFHLGMTRSDATILAKHYGLANDEWECEAEDSGERVKSIKFTLLGIKRIAKSANTYKSILASVCEELKMQESDDLMTQVRTISKQIARITEDDGLRIFHEKDGDPTKTMVGKDWEKAKDTINKSDPLDILGGLLLLEAIGL